MKFPVFVLEGADCCGKTTLAQVLVRKTKGHYLHSRYRFPGKMGAYHWAQLRKAIRLADTAPVILDRWWPSEIVYGNVYRDGPEKNYDWRQLHSVAEYLGFSYTFCMPLQWNEYLEWVQERYRNEDQMYPFNEARLHFTWLNYRNLMLDTYNVFERDNLHYYNVVHDAYRANMFADHVISRWRFWMSRQTADRKAAIKAYVWKQARPEYVNLNETAEAPNAIQPALL